MYKSPFIISFLLIIIFFNFAYGLDIDTFNFNNHQLEVSWNPFSLKIIRNDNIIAKTDVNKPLFFPNFNTSLTIVQTRQEIPNGINYYLTNDGIEVNVSITVEANSWIKIVVAPNGGSTGETGIIFDHTGASWYGLGETRDTPFPLNGVDKTLKVADGGDNLLAPILVNNLGLGLVLDTKSIPRAIVGINNQVYFSESDTSVSKPYNLYLFADSSPLNTVAFISQKFGLPKNLPAPEFFQKAFWSTWVEQRDTGEQNQAQSFVEAILATNIPSHAILLDVNWDKAWAQNGPLWDFDLTRFPDPQAFINYCHSNNLKVMLYTVPSIGDQSPHYDYAWQHNFLVKTSNCNLYKYSYWGGTNHSLIDLGNPFARTWFLDKLQTALSKWNADGINFDGGEDFPEHSISLGKLSPNTYAAEYAKLSAYFPYSEVRTGWLGTPAYCRIARVFDIQSCWYYGTGDTLGLYPGMRKALAMSIIGYPYINLDMIGGNQYLWMSASKLFFARYAEIAAFTPIMQYSWGPWHYDEELVNICRKYTELHSSLYPYIYGLAKQASEKGQMILRPLFFHYPSDPQAQIDAEAFMLGPYFLIAPPYNDESTINFYLPGSKWLNYWDGEILEGGKNIVLNNIPIDKLPVYIPEGAIIPTEEENKLKLFLWPTEKQTNFTLPDGPILNLQAIAGNIIFTLTGENNLPEGTEIYLYEENDQPLVIPSNILGLALQSEKKVWSQSGISTWVYSNPNVPYLTPIPELVATPTLSNPLPRGEVYNGNFEKNISCNFKVASGWEPFGQAKWEGVQDQFSWSQQISELGPNSSAGIYQIVKGVKANQHYRLQAKAKSTFEQFYVSIGLNNSVEVNLPEVVWSEEINANLWSDLEVGINTTEDYLAVLLRVRNSNPDWALLYAGLFDQVSLEAVGTPWSTATPQATTTATPTKNILFGDVNCDNEVTPGDALIAFQFYLELISPPGPCVSSMLAADIDQNGEITPGDALCIFLVYLGRDC